MMVKPYPAYKDSGIAWLGKIPSHWDTVRLKFVTKNLNQQSLPIESQRYIALENLQSWSGKFIETETDSVSLDLESGSKCFEPGDVLFNKLRPYLAKFYLAQEYGTCVGELLVLRSRRDIILSEYLFWNIASKAFINVVDGSTYGAKMPRASFDFIGNMLFPIPPLPEQRTIAAYLDHQTQALDELIADKRRLIELYQEERAALINQAVTRGLDPDAPMKDSGIEWLGEIPGHWEVKKIGHICKVVRGSTPRPAGDPKYFDGDFLPWITVGELTNAPGKYVEKTGSFLTKEGSKFTRIVSPGTLLLSNSGATLGIPRFTSIEGGINDGCAAFLDATIHLDFLYYFFLTHTKIYRDESSGHGQPNLNTTIIRSTPLPIPPMEDQKNISSYIDAKTSQLDTQIADTEREIELLQEYRTALISEVVTGKVDVRGEGGQGME